MNINIEMLRTAINHLLNHAKDMSEDNIEIDEDFYWFIPKKSLYEASSPPTELTLGSLEHDWSEMSAIAGEDKDLVGYALVWASAILRALGDKIP